MYILVSTVQGCEMKTVPIELVLVNQLQRSLGLSEDCRMDNSPIKNAFALIGALPMTMLEMPGNIKSWWDHVCDFSQHDWVPALLGGRLHLVWKLSCVPCWGFESVWCTPLLHTEILKHTAEEWTSGFIPSIFRFKETLKRIRQYTDFKVTQLICPARSTRARGKQNGSIFI